MKPPPHQISQGTGSLVLVEAALTEPLAVALPGGTALVFTHPSPGRDRPNQDAAAVIPVRTRELLLAVADGMGGMRQGGEAAATLIRELVAKFPLAEDESPMRAAVLDGIEEANQRILSELPASGTTLAAVEICDQTIRPYHVGDSTILVIGQRGKVKLQTIPHSPVGFAVEAGLLDERDALQHDDLHIVSNAIGCPEMRIELGAPLELARYDTLLIASDGLTDNVHLDEIISLVRKGPLAEGMRRLVELARARMATVSPSLPCKPDDLTLLVYRRSA